MGSREKGWHFLPLWLISLTEKNAIRRYLNRKYIVLLDKEINFFCRNFSTFKLNTADLSFLNRVRDLTNISFRSSCTAWTLHDRFWIFLVFKRSQTTENAHIIFKHRVRNGCNTERQRLNLKKFTLNPRY